MKKNPAPKPTPLEAQEEAFVRALLPVYDLDFVRGRLAENDPPYEFRQDVVTAIHRAIEAKVERFPHLVRNLGLTKLERVSDDCLKSSNADDARQLMLAVAYRNLKMLEIGWLTDPRDQAVLVALLLTDEAEQDGEEWGNIQAAKLCADKMIRWLRWSGLYATQAPSLH